MTKQEAISFILKCLKSPMSMVSKPTSDKAFQAAEEHGITATDLLKELQEIVWKV